MLPHKPSKLPTCGLSHMRSTRHLASRLFCVTCQEFTHCANHRLCSISDPESHLLSQNKSHHQSGFRSLSLSLSLSLSYTHTHTHTHTHSLSLSLSLLLSYSLCSLFFEVRRSDTLERRQTNAEHGELCLRVKLTHASADAERGKACSERAGAPHQRAAGRARRAPSNNATLTSASSAATSE